MNLELLISPSGFGKTHFILEDIEKERENNKIIVLTPEQNSFNFEKLLCDKFGGTFNIDVMNFSTLTKSISKKIGLDNFKNINDDIKPFYLYKAAKNLEDKENFLVKRILQDTNFIEVVEDIIKELKEYRVSINTLEEYLKNNTTLEKSHREKLEAILELYVEYNSILKMRTSFDKEDYINEFLLYVDYADLSDYIFYIDAYYNFATQEYAYIEKLIQKSKKVVMSVIADSNRYFNIDLAQLSAGYDIDKIKYLPFYLSDLNSSEKYKLDIFRKSHELVANFNEIVKRNKELNFSTVSLVDNGDIFNIRLNIEGQVVTNYEVLSNHKSRFLGSDTYLLASNYYKAFTSNKITDNSVEIIKAKNKELEVKEVARRILKLREDKNIKNSDIAILYRDSVYENYEYIFKDYGIDIHLDKNIEVRNHRLIKFITEILSFSNNDFRNSLVNIFKTKLTNFENIYKGKLLEKVVFGTNEMTSKELVQSYSELDEKVRSEKISVLDIKSELEDYSNIDEVLASIEELSVDNLENILNKKLVNSIEDINKESFIESINNISTSQLEVCRDIINELVEKIEVINKNTQVKRIIKRIEDIFDYCNIKMYLDKEDGEYDDIEELKIDSIDRQVYKKTLEFFKNIIDSFGDEKIEYSKFVELVVLGLATIKYRAIPEINTSVVMAKMDLAKVENKKVVFVVGFNKDCLPISKKPGLLDDKDKENFYSANIYLSPQTTSSMIDEEFVAYIALTRACEKTYICYSLLDKSYKENFASPYLITVKKLIKGIKEETTSNILEFNLGKYDYYLNNMDEILTKKEYSYLFSKIYRRFIEIRNSGTNEEKVLENLLEVFLKNYIVLEEKNDNTKYYLQGELNDRVYFNKEDSVKNYINKLIKQYKFELEEESIEKFKVKNNTNFSKFSISKIADYEKNPYLFFVKRVMGINEERDIDIDALVQGKFFHAVLSERKIIELIISLGEKLGDFEDASDEKLKEKFNIRSVILDVIYSSSNNDIKELLDLVKLLNTYNYNFENIITRLELAILLEIKYYSITKYRPTLLEKKFELEITKSKISCTELDTNKVITKDLKNEYNIPHIKFVGTIDRVDFFEKNILVIDYKSSKSDFSLKDLELGLVSQVLTYSLACEMLLGKSSDSILGIFYREIAKTSGKLSDYRLRGVVNEDLAKLSDFNDTLDSVMYYGFKKNGEVKKLYQTKSYTSPQLSQLVEKNLENILKVLEKIYTFDYSLDNYDIQEEYVAEKETLYKYAASVQTDLKLKNKGSNLKGEDLKKEVLK